jgi:hypothetical protein
MARKIALTPAAIDNHLKGLLADLQTPGLAIEVLGSGKKRWRYRRKLARISVVVSLYGKPFPSQSIADARECLRHRQWRRSCVRLFAVGRAGR